MSKHSYLTNLGKNMKQIKYTVIVKFVYLVAPTIDRNKLLTLTLTLLNPSEIRDRHQCN